MVLVILFGNRWALLLIKRGKETQRQTQGEHHMTVETD